MPKYYINKTWFIEKDPSLTFVSIIMCDTKNVSKPLSHLLYLLQYKCGRIFKKSRAAIGSGAFKLKVGMDLSPIQFHSLSD